MSGYACLYTRTHGPLRFRRRIDKWEENGRIGKKPRGGIRRKICICGRQQAEEDYDVYEAPMGKRSVL